MMIWAMKLLGIAKRIPWPVWAALIVLAAWWIDRSAQYREGRAEGYRAAQEEYRAAEARAATVQQESASVASTERKADQGKSTANQLERDNAIKSVQEAGAPSAARNALNCERLRAAGASVQHIPACRGR